MRDFAVIAIAACLVLTGCASTSGSLQRATALSIGHNVAPEQINVTDVRRKASSVRWTAETPDGAYSCSADDMVRRPYCVKR